MNISQVITNITAVAFVLLGLVSVRAGYTQPSASGAWIKILYYFFGLLFTTSGVGTLIAPESMSNVAGILIGDAYPKTEADAGWTQGTDNGQELQKELSSAPTPIDPLDDYSGYSSNAMDYTFGAVTSITPTDVPATMTVG